MLVVCEGMSDVVRCVIFTSQDENGKERVEQIPVQGSEFTIGRFLFSVLKNQLSFFSPLPVSATANREILLC